MPQLAIGRGGVLHRRRLAFVAAVGGVLLTSLAHAQFLGSCSVSASNVAYGTYDPLAVANLTSTGTVTVTCSGVALFSVPVTVALNAGLSGSFTPRKMTSGANSLTYNLYTDVANTMIWGDGTHTTKTVSLTVNIPLFGSGSASATVRATVPKSQDVSPGTYTDTITVTVSY